jgi:MFS superfamily sulfate permease-like transporter
MGESEWEHASWVSSFGKWAWIIIIFINLIGILYIVGISFIQWWNPFYWATQIWNIISIVVGIAIAFLIIKPKFSKPCGEKDWDALLEWTLALGSFKIPWMFIWGLFLALFGWYALGSLPVLIPAFVLVFMGPKEYKWSEEKAPK